MRRLLIGIPLVFALCLPALAAPDACSTWKKYQKSLTKNQEDPYWDSVDQVLSEIWSEWVADYKRWSGDPDRYRNPVHSYTRLRAVYGQYLELQDARLRVDAALATSGHARALETLFAELLDVIKDCESLEKQLAEGRPVAYYSRFYDQTISIKRHGLAARHDGLLAQLAGIPGAAAWLAEAGWSQAKRGDKTKSLARRAAVLDLLGRTKDAAGRPLLEQMLTAPQPGLRIVAIENLVPFGLETLDLLKPRLQDPAPAVRRALLESLGTLGVDEPRWIPLALEGYREQRGLVRARGLEALSALTGEVLPDDPAAWADWYAKHEEAIRAGTWARPEPKEDEGKEGGAKADEAKEEDGEKEEPEPPPRVRPEPLTTFYGVGAPSRAVVFAFDGSTDMDLPADLSVQLKKAKSEWQGLAPGWKSEFTDHRNLLMDQLGAAIDAMTGDARFAVIHLRGTSASGITVLGEKKPLKPRKGTRKKVLRTIEKERPEGQQSIEEATRIMFRICGQDPLADPKSTEELLDTMFIVAPGWNGGRWAIPEAMIADFRRWNRFHRIQVNAIRILDQKEESVRLMKGLADASGGTYLWLEKLPQ